MLELLSTSTYYSELWLPLLSGLIGGVLATSGSILTQRHLHKLTTTQERNSLANALSGEIAALCSIIERRGYLDDMKESRQSIQTSGQEAPFKVNVQYDYLMVYKSNLGSIGLLPAHLAASVTRFYTQIQALLEEATSPTEEHRSSLESLDILDEQIALLEDSLKLGQDLSKRLSWVK